MNKDREEYDEEEVDRDTNSIISTFMVGVILSIAVCSGFIYLVIHYFG